MAYVASKGGWLKYEARAQYIKEMREEFELLLQFLEVADADVTAHDLDRMEFLTEELARVESIHRGEYDVHHFGFTYASEWGNFDNPDNLIPEGTDPSNSAELHKTLCSLFNDVASGKQSDHVAWAVARDHAKTSWISNIFLLHQVAYRHRKYIVLFSETTDVAGDFISWSKFQLKLNTKLREDFGDLLDVKASRNELDNKWEYITTSGTKVEAKGLGTQTRGLRHGNTRPDLFILDDLESKDSTNTPELIEKSKRWFNEEMLPALSKDNGICVYLGTILCYGSLLHYVINERKDFKSRLFSAVQAFSEREDLWNEWRLIYREDDEESPARAKLFFLENEEEMLKGTQVLWERRWSYYDLMLKLENAGAKTFAQEYQNTPTDSERQIFKEEYFHWYSDEDIAHLELEPYGAIDVAMGKDKGDYTVIATLMKNKNTDAIYIHDMFVERVHPDILIKKTVEYTLKYQYERLGIETQFAQEFIADKIKEELQKHGYPGQTRIKYIKQRTRKTLRIEAMLPDIQNGRIRFHEKFRKSETLDQFLLYPMHPHDDALDAIAMAVDTAKSGKAYVGMARPGVQRW